MSMPSLYKVTLIDTANERHVIHFKRFEYPNLMELIIDNTYDDIGDCKGRAMCKTCLVEPINPKEVTGINFINIPEDTDYVLACQIIVDKHINNCSFKILDRD
ncbi:2Fe-2S iron-sulfur cluster-binding protein [Algibacter pacificus]|uniref:2Fe-2S iron-sulfur cluster-binding protein n=1 Tax=Algibacter pacificus TaxID=2599389 RepID=UPI0011CB0ACE|nr:2Fe-2S iron-sulfur cluster-binding protein [Algibacter pacificus]